jgi:hypothetical protein
MAFCPLWHTGDRGKAREPDKSRLFKRIFVEEGPFAHIFVHAILEFVSDIPKRHRRSL